jgi:hypothetical protein
LSASKSTRSLGADTVISSAHQKSNFRIASPFRLR